MTNTDFPEKWQDLLSRRTVAELTSEEQSELAKLLQAHPNLRSQLSNSSLASSEDDIASPVSEPEAHALVKSQSAYPLTRLSSNRFIQKVVASNRLESLLTRQRLILGSQVVGGAIAIAALAMLSLSNQQLRRSLLLQTQKLDEAEATIQTVQSQQQVTNVVLSSLQNSQSVYALEGAGEFAGMAGSVVTVADENKAVLVAPDLPSLSAEEIYRFWATTDTKARLMYCGQFTVDNPNVVEWMLPTPACTQQANQAVITIDPITASTASGGQVVLRSRSIKTAD
ncbi:MAG: anti-sigma factor [Cyanobacteria bacterium P01_C01_bin.120]